MHDGHSDPEAERWRTNVGAVVHMDGPAAAARAPRAIDVLSWNVAIGLGRLDHLLDLWRDGAIGDSSQRDARPLVLLLQEAFRADSSVPDRAASPHHGGRAPTTGKGSARTDVVEFARRRGLSLYFAPSMRNGAHASDRGNAILSTARLVEPEMLRLPWVRQRRVAVGAALDGCAGLRFVSAHLDTHGRAVTRADSPPAALRPGSGRAVQARALGAWIAGQRGSCVLGADLNSLFGMSDPAVRELVVAGLHPARRIGDWRHTFHTPFRLLVDHVLYRCAEPHTMRAEVVRLDEAPRDRSRTVFGSDHHPLFARIDLENP